MTRISRITMACVFLCGSASIAAAQSVEQFYRGKTVTIVVGSSPGGGYDAYARLLGRHFSKHIPGSPTVVVSNMPGGGSEIAAGYVANVAPKDGTYIAATYSNQPLDSVLENVPPLPYDPKKLKYLGSAAQDDWLCVVRSNSPAQSFADAFKTQVAVAGVMNAQTGYVPMMMNRLLGTKFKVIVGYPGSREQVQAIQTGEVDGMCGLGYTSLKSQYPSMLKNGEFKIILQVMQKELPELTAMGVPIIGSFIKDDVNRRVFEIVSSQQEFNRPYFVGPGVPEDRLAALRSAFMQAWKDPELLKEAGKMSLDVMPMSGSDMQARLEQIYSSPPEVLKLAREAVDMK